MCKIRLLGHRSWTKAESWAYCHVFRKGEVKDQGREEPRVQYNPREKVSPDAKVIRDLGGGGDDGAFIDRGEVPAVEQAKSGGVDEVVPERDSTRGKERGTASRVVLNGREDLE